MIDWNKCAEAFDDTAAEKLCKSRGYSPDIVAFLREKRLVGLYRGKIAFVTEGGAHFKVEDGSWRFTDGAKASPFILGGIEEGAHINCFESQWCAISYADLSGDRENIVASRGAGNSKLIADAIGSNFTGIVYLWPQNDAPGRKWAEDIRKLLPDVQVRLCHTPEQFKDINEFIKSGATAGALLNLYIDAKDFPVNDIGGLVAGPTTPHLALPAGGGGENNLSGGVEGGHAPDRDSGGYNGTSNPPQSGSSAPPAQNNLPAVPVLVSPTEAHGMGHKLESEARESTTVLAEQSAVGNSAGAERNSDSRGGRQSLQGVSPAGSGGRLLPSNAEGSIPSSLQTIVTLAQALDAIEALYHKYVRFPEPWHYTVAATWSAYTWVWKAFDYTPYLLIRGPEENCGKTRVLKCLLALAPKVFGGNITCNVSGPAMFREIEDEQPVFLLDEVDKFFGYGSDDPVVGLLNAGYERGGTVIRNNIKAGKNEKFTVFCPKAFAGIGDKVDNTTASRAIHIHMARQTVGDMAAPLRSHIINREVCPIRIFLQAWGENATKILYGVFPELPDELANDGRKAEITEPLVAVADMAGPEWAGKAREDLVCAFDQPKDDSEGTKLLKSIKRIFDTLDWEKILTHKLVEYLLKDDEGPWSTWWERDFAAGRWHGAAHKIGKMLDGYRVKSKNVRVGEEQGKGYLRADFAKAWQTYLPSQAKAENMELQLI